MSDKKSYMDRQNILAEGFFSKLFKILGLSSSKDRAKIQRSKNIQQSLLNLNNSWSDLEKSVSKATGKPFKFIVDKDDHGLTQEELTKEINVNQANWEIKDWLHKWVVKGLDPYIRFERFLERHSFKQIYNALQIFSHSNKGAGTFREEFENGTFNPTDSEWKNAEAFMGEIKDVSKIWNPAGAVFKSYFIGAYREVNTHPDFCSTQFLTKLKRYLSEFRECAKSKDYIDLINIIYNKGQTVENKVWLA